MSTPPEIPSGASRTDLNNLQLITLRHSGARQAVLLLGIMVVFFLFSGLICRLDIEIVAMMGVLIAFLAWAYVRKMDSVSIDLAGIRHVGPLTSHPHSPEWYTQRDIHL